MKHFILTVLVAALSATLLFPFRLSAQENTSTLQVPEFHDEITIQDPLLIPERERLSCREQPNQAQRFLSPFKKIRTLFLLILLK